MKTKYNRIAAYHAFTIVVALVLMISARQASGYAAAGGSNALNNDIFVAIGDGAQTTSTSTTGAAAGGVAIGHDASAGAGATALGVGADASGSQSTAIGSGSSASGASSTAIGMTAVASGQRSFALGQTAYSTGTNAVAIGYYSSATAKDSISIGTYSGASAEGSIALGNNSFANRTAQTYIDPITGISRTTTYGAISVGHTGGERQIINVADGSAGTDAVNLRQLDYVRDIATNNTASIAALSSGGSGSTTQKYFHANSTLADSQATGADSVAIGPAAVASGDQSFAAGYNSSATGNRSTAVGMSAMAEDGTSSAFGSYSKATKSGGAALGYYASALATNSTAIGSFAYATGEDSIAIGRLSNIEGENAIGIGRTTSAKQNGVSVGYTATSDTNAVAVGNLAKATGYGSVSVGTSSEADGRSGVAVGRSARAHTEGSVAVGTTSTVTGEKGTALGSLSQANQDNSIALGSYSVADRAGFTYTDPISGVSRTTTYGALSIGTATQQRQIINVADGSADTDAVNLRQLDYVRDIATNNTASIAALSSGGSGSTTQKYFNANSTLADSQATGGNSVAIGPESVASGAQSVAIGKDATASGSRSLAIGEAASAAGAQSIAIGYDASVASGSSSSIALGHGSKADRDSMSLLSYTDPFSGATRSSADGVVSFGDTTGSFMGMPGARQLIHVADGSEDTDAVNVRQLKFVRDIATNNTQNVANNLTSINSNSLSIANSNTAISSNAQNIVNNYSLVTNNTQNIVNNYSLVTNNTQSIANNLTLINSNSLSIANSNTAISSNAQNIVNNYSLVTNNTQNIANNFTLINSNSLNIANSFTAISSNTQSIANNFTLITNSIDIATQNIANNYSLITNNVDIATQNITYNYSSITNLNAQLNSLGDHSVQYATNLNGTISYNLIPLQGSNGTVIANLADGAISSTSTEAVNGSQLWDYTLNTNNLLSSTNLYNQIAGLSSSLSGTSAGAVQYATNSNGSINFDLISFGGTNGTVLTNIKSGTVSQGSTDAINGNQFWNATQNTNNTQSSVSLYNAIVNNYGNTNDPNSNVSLSEALAGLEDGAVQYATNPDGSVNYNLVPLLGTNGTVIANVADGVDSNDAVNVSQLMAVGAVVSSNTQNIAGNYSLITNNVENIANNYSSITNLNNRLTGLGDSSVKYATNANGSVNYDLVSFGGTNGTVLTNIKSGTVSQGSTDAINGDQFWNATQNTNNTQSSVSLYSAIVNNYGNTNDPNSNVSLSEALAGLGAGAVQYATNVDGSVNYNLVQLLGSNGTVMANLANGEISSTSSEAVNGSQLWNYTLNTNNLLSSTNLYNSIAGLSTNIGALAGNTVQYDDASYGVITLGGSNGTIIANVAAGVNSNDAVNLAQLLGVHSIATNNSANILNNFALITNNAQVIANNYGNTNDPNSNVSLSEALADLGEGAVQYATNTDGSVNYDLVQLLGSNGTVMANLANGEISSTSSEAVNGSQLWDYTLNTNNQLSSTNLYNSIAGLSTDLSTLADGSVQYATNTDGSVNYDIVSFGGTNGTLLMNLLAGDVSEGSTDAVTGGQLWDYTLNTNNMLSNTNLYNSIAGLGTNLNTLTAGAVQYGTNTDGSVNYDLVSFGGTNGTLLTNLKAGDLIQGSTDAITGGQLWDFTFNTNNLLSSTNLYNQIVSNYSNTNDPNSNISIVNALTNLSGGVDALADIAVQYGTNTDGSVNYDLVSLSGTNGTLLTNLKAGSIGQFSTDAINGSQLWNWTLDTNNELSNTNLYTRIVNNYNTITNIQNDVANNYTATTNNAAGIASNYSSITNIQNNVANNSAAISNNTAAIQNNYTAITNNAAGIAGNYSAITNNAAGIASNYSAITNLASIAHDHNGSGIDSTVLWTNDVASGDYAVALGGAEASAELTTAVGYGASANGFHASAFGEGATAAGTNSTAIGGESLASGANASAFGHGAQATEDGSTAMGANARAHGVDAVAIGNKAYASGDNSVALGTGSVAYEENTVSIGSADNKRRLTNVAAGRSGTDAANMQQLGALEDRINDSLETIDENIDKAYGGIAAVAAIPPLVPPSAPGKTTCQGGAAYYEGEYAVGVNLTHRLKGRLLEEHRTFVNGGVAVSSEETVVTRAVIGFEF